MTVMTPRVVDVSHYEKITSYTDAVTAGIWGAICKCTQGSGDTAFHDHTYNDNIIGFRSAHALVGAYHFGDGSDPKTQVDWFLKNANYSGGMVLALDFEDYPKSNMTIHSMVAWLRYFEEKMSFKAILYTGNRLKDLWSELNAEDQAYVCQHRLWLAEYNPTYHLPHGFTKLWLWQYTGDGAGNTPHFVPGITLPGGKGLDLNSYDGTKEQLILDWTGINVATPPSTITQPPLSTTPPAPPIVPTHDNQGTSSANTQHDHVTANNTVKNTIDVSSKPPVETVGDIIEDAAEGFKKWLTGGINH